MTEAANRGYHSQSTTWANLGQGAPETNPLPGAPERLTSVAISPADHEYAPIDGLVELREAVANLYNERYRQGKKSKYTKDNVAISAGGRVAVTRTISSLGKTNVGHFLPDYTAYEELLDTFGSFVPIPILLDSERGYQFSAEELDKEILGRGFSAILMSNPCNPTGKTIFGEELKAWVEVARNRSCTLIFDEFYSHYLFETEALSSSAAAYVEDVNSDPIIVVDGLTKNWRYPGFRVAWTVGPKQIIEGITSAGSFIDGGCPRPMQVAALSLVKREIADQEALAIKTVFRQKRDFMLKALNDLGIVVSPKPAGGFYCWGDLKHLPESINTGMKLFKLGLEAGLITVPGSFFDINPGHRRPDRQSRFANYTRFSFGPSMEEVKRGLAILEKLVKAAK
jgi:aspartate/methionine/tyrosine aminotransferase